MKLKYAMKLGGNLIAKGTEVEVIPPSDPRVRDRLNPESYICLVQFPNREKPTYMHVSQLEE